MERQTRKDASPVKRGRAGAVNREIFSFPVGKVDELTMYQLDFEEFLWAMNHSY
jgi:hypothetical protein